MMFMKIYSQEHIHASLAGVDEKTFRKWSWIFIDAIAGLEYEVVRILKCCMQNYEQTITLIYHFSFPTNHSSFSTNHSDFMGEQIHRRYRGRLFGVDRWGGF